MALRYSFLSTRDVSKIRDGTPFRKKINDLFYKCIVLAKYLKTYIVNYRQLNMWYVSILSDCPLSSCNYLTIIMDHKILSMHV